MSLRGSETTEAISQGIEKTEIAALPSVARNDKEGLRHSLKIEGGCCETSSSTSKNTSALYFAQQLQNIKKLSSVPQLQP